jgi:hypothetical protein
VYKRQLFNREFTALYQDKNLGFRFSPPPSKSGLSRCLHPRVRITSLGVEIGRGNLFLTGDPSLQVNLLKIITNPIYSQ